MPAKPPIKRELPIPPNVANDSKAREFLRAWFDGDQLHVSIEPGIAKRPEAWGVLLADISRHVCKAYGIAHPKTFVEDIETIMVTFFSELGENDPGDEWRISITRNA